MSETTLWTPGNPLDLNLSSPTQAELRDEFSRTVMPSTEITSIDHALSALVVPERPIRGLATIDIDDFFADTSGSLQGLSYGQPMTAAERSNNHDYGEGLFFDDSESSLKQGLFHLLRGSEAGLRVTSELNDIRTIISSWRASGIYTGFVSALTSGSELSAVNNFIGRYFKNNCDFLVIADGHYDVADKGAAVRAIVDTLGAHTSMPVVHMDDWPSHLIKVRSAVRTYVPKLAMLGIQYDFPSHTIPDPDSAHAKSPLEACDIATEFFARALGKSILETGRPSWQGGQV